MADDTDVSVAAGWEGASASELVLWAAKLFVWWIRVVAVAPLSSGAWLPAL